MMTERPYKRRRFLLDSFQYRLLVFNLLYLLTVLMITAVLIFAPIMMKLDNPSVSPAEQQHVADLLLSLHVWFWPVILVVFILLALHSIRVSHRIAGALYRFQVVFGEVADGNLSVRATLRKNDYLTKEAAALNEMLSALRERIWVLQVSSSTLQALQGELQAAVEHQSAEQLQRASVRLREELGALHEQLAQFRAADPGGGSGLGQNGQTSSPTGSTPSLRASDST